MILFVIQCWRLAYPALVFISTVFVAPGNIGLFSSQTKSQPKMLPGATFHLPRAHDDGAQARLSIF
jgi:hypothetical protein